MNIINLTPHALTICGENGVANLYRIEPSGQVARIKTEREEIGAVRPDGGQFDIPVYRTIVSGEPINLPDSQPDTIYIVSGVFRMYFDREDLYQPGELVRDATGNPVGCIGLSR